MPRGVMSAEVRQRASATRAERRQQMAQAREASALTIGPYRVYRGDELNWFVTRTGESTRYYSTLPDALAGLLRMRIGDRARGNLEGLMRAVEQAQAEVVASVQAADLEARQEPAAPSRPPR